MTEAEFINLTKGVTDKDFDDTLTAIEKIRAHVAKLEPDADEDKQSMLTAVLLMKHGKRFADS